MQNREKPGLLKQRFETYQEEAGHDLWQRIEAGLDEKEKRRGIIWWWYALGLAACLSGVLFWWNDHSGVESVQGNVQQEQSAKMTRQNSSEARSAKKTGDVWDEPKKKEENVNKKSPKQVPKKKKDQLFKEKGIERFNEEETHQERLEAELPISSLKLADATPFSLDIASYDITKISKPQIKERNTLWEVGVWIGKSYEGQKVLPTSKKETIYTAVNSSETVDEVLRVRKMTDLGLFLGSYLGKRWAWRLALGYLQYDVQTSSGAKYDRLQALKIPVSLKYEVFQRPRWTAYLNAGMQNEFVWDHPQGGPVSLDQFQKSSTPGVGKFSQAISLGAGTSIHLYRSISLEIEPQYHHYIKRRFFLGGDALRDRHWLSMNLGLKYQF
ncbi:MAG: hypothetical protein EP338_02695 [Bacteroidetes bacterium]|nr:MAG: hypothetical protein EP338_02695 [Bacteroidota bacterium]